MHHKHFDIHFLWQEHKLWQIEKLVYRILFVFSEHEIKGQMLLQIKDILDWNFNFRNLMEIVAVAAN